MADLPIDPSADAALVPVREQTVDFYGDVLRAGELADGTILVPLRPICDALGLAWPGQFMRLKRDPVLAPELRSVIVTITELGERSMLSLPLKLLPGWLFGITSSRVRPELRDKIVHYQRNAYEVLWNAFKGDILPTSAAPPPATELSGAALAYEIATAIQTLARQQMEMEARLGDVAGRQEAVTAFLRPFVEQTRRELAAHTTRLTALELQLSAGATISEDQAAEIALAVKTVGQALAARGERNGYAKVYDEVLAWLAGWYGELTSAAGPDPGSTG